MPHRRIIRDIAKGIDREFTVAGPEPLVNGPLRAAYGPTDYEGLGRERYWDLPSHVRESKEMLASILEQTKPFTPEPDRRFAMGYLSEHERATKHRRID